MRAAIFNQPGMPLAIETVPDPVPGAGQIVLRVLSCGICGSDLHATSGHGFTAPRGQILGHEFCGEIVELGKSVTALKVGDVVNAMPVSGCGACPQCLAGDIKWCPTRLTMQGGYGEFMLAGADTTFRLPGGLSAEDGALVEPMAVGLHAAAVARISVGDRVLVMGAGPVGLAATFWARRLGAGTVAVATPTNRTESLARAMGATDYIATGGAEDPVALVNETLGGPPDVVIECAGVVGIIGQAVAHVRRRGTVVVAGLCTQPDTWQPTVGFFKEVNLTFAYLYSPREFELCLNTLDGGHVEPRQMITDRVSLSQLPDMFESLRHRTTQCKVMVDPRLG